LGRTQCIEAMLPYSIASPALSSCATSAESWWRAIPGPVAGWSLKSRLSHDDRESIGYLLTA
jgi:hypothetical protein